MRKGSGLRFLLAGGLNIDNVQNAIDKVRPWGVDVATGVESSPGRKDPKKLRMFIEAAKAGDDDGFTEPTVSRPDGERSKLDDAIDLHGLERSTAMAPDAARPFNWEFDD